MIEDSPSKQDLIVVSKGGNLKVPDIHQNSIKSEVNEKSYFNKPHNRGSVISSDADTLGKRRLSADPQHERNHNDTFSNYQSSKGTNSSKQASNSRFVDQAKVYSSMQALPKHHPQSIDDSGSLSGKKGGQ